MWLRVSQVWFCHQSGSSLPVSDCQMQQSRTDFTFQKALQETKSPNTAQAAPGEGQAQLEKGFRVYSGSQSPPTLPPRKRKKPTRAGVLKSLAPLPSAEALPASHHATQVMGRGHVRTAGGERE